MSDDPVADFLADAEEKSEALFDDLKEIGGDLIEELKPLAASLVRRALFDLAKLKIKAAQGENITQELRFVESSLQDLRALASVNVLIAMQKVFEKSAEFGTAIFKSLFNRLVGS